MSNAEVWKFCNTEKAIFLKLGNTLKEKENRVPGQKTLFPIVLLTLIYQGSFHYKHTMWFHFETTWKRSFPRRFNVEYTWGVCRESLELLHFFALDIPFNVAWLTSWNSFSMRNIKMLIWNYQLLYCETFNSKLAGEARKDVVKEFDIVTWVSFYILQILFGVWMLMWITLYLQKELGTLRCIL